jgi:hypothetical protein
MDLTLFRVITPFVAVGIFVTACILIRPQGYIIKRALIVCWLAGILSLVADTIALNMKLWHYTFANLVFGLPLDFYFSISMVAGGAICLIFWWLKMEHNKASLPFLLMLPFLGLLGSYVVSVAAGKDFLVWETQLWWIAIFATYAAIFWIELFVFYFVAIMNRSR